MNDQTTYLKPLALALLLLIFIVDLMAVSQLFQNFIQITLFGAILGIQTLLILSYHQRCLKCKGCMAKAGRGIYLFYKVFAAIGFFSMLIILLNDVFLPENANLKVIVALTYAALLIIGASTAFNAIIGVSNVSGCGTAPTDTNNAPQQSTAETKTQEAQTLLTWEAEEAARRQKSLETQKKQAFAREQARRRMEKRNKSEVQT